MIKDERGIVLTELFVVLAIGGLVTGLLVTAIYQVYHVTGWGNAELSVQHDLQNAATWLNRDVMSTSSAEVSGSQMVLTIPYFSGSSVLTRIITYTHSAAEASFVRDCGDSTLIVARQVDSVSFSPTGPVVTSAITITLTSRASDISGSAVLHLDMRPTE